MIRRLHATARDRLFAAGLLSFIVALLLLGWHFTDDNGAMMIIGLFVAGEVVFSASALRRGAPVQRLLAAVFMVPAFAYLIILLKKFFL